MSPKDSGPRLSFAYPCAANPNPIINLSGTSFHSLWEVRSEALVPLLEMCIICEMYRAEVEPMSSNPPDRVPRSGLWKVAIYEGERFVRTDKENMIISVAEMLAEELNYQFGHKRKARGAN